MCISCHKVEPDPGSKATPRQPSKPRHAWPRAAQWGAARAQRAAGEEIFWHAFPRFYFDLPPLRRQGARAEKPLQPQRCLSSLPDTTTLHIEYFNSEGFIKVQKFQKLAIQNQESSNSNTICKNYTRWWMRNLGAEFVVPFSSRSLAHKSSTFLSENIII